MNRIILIGNGFDLAHGMKTSYRDFIDNYWETFKTQVENHRQIHSGYISYDDGYECVKMEVPYMQASDNSENNLVELSIPNRGTVRGKIIFNNKFWEQICNHIDDKNWVDIENEYYERLKKCNHYEAIALNKEFAQIEKMLKEYLKDIQRKIEVDFFPKESIKDKIIFPICLDDLSYSGENEFVKDVIYEAYRIKNNEYASCQVEVREFVDEIVTSREASINHEGGISKKGIDHVKKIISNKQIQGDLLQPRNVFLLNFNYTQMANRYVRWRGRYGVTYIHGELNNPKNPMIFGYGDELAEDYKKIEELNDNEYLKNVKSIRYLEANNYRRLLSFIESEPYQVFIMGHSCGNSDRTLLNTLFEHKNCVSIKPFYHKKEDGSDNYSEIVQNISRNFKNKALMRERVVNKAYCEPLV